MWFWSALILYAAGWMISLPTTLRIRMLGKECDRCGLPKKLSKICEHWCSQQARFRVRAEIRDRNEWDAFAAFRMSFLWPAFVAYVFSKFAVKRFGRLILKVAPLTRPELERKLKEREAEIARLMKEIQ